MSPLLPTLVLCQRSRLEEEVKEQGQKRECEFLGVGVGTDYRYHLESWFKVRWSKYNPCLCHQMQLYNLDRIHAESLKLSK